MSCDEYFERCLQKKYDAVLRPKDKAISREDGSAQPHRLLGTDICLESDGREEIFLEAVTGIEFREGKILFQTALGEILPLRCKLERVILREGGVVLQTKL
ncbi:MAG: CooT family nickel-binding protein [Candidatus Manganitrophaceae bacterium]|nr:MAG: CooT family nickel-binding protein [Candidatus Manganitrophaceae bacterium]